MLPKGIPFALFCSLLREISKIKPKSVANRRPGQETRTSYPALQVFNRWLENLRKHYSPLPPGTTATCFRLLFPEEDTKRKYDIQETRLARYLSETLGIPLEKLENWDSRDATGCFGAELERLLQLKSPDEESFSTLTIADVDELLDELAATSAFSHESIRKKYPPHAHRPKLDTLKTLFRQLPPLETAFLTHIILKDLRPILYPFPDVNSSVALLNFNTKAVKMLTKQDVMIAWDPSGYMLKLHRLEADLDAVSTAFELPHHAKPVPKPNLGSMIQLPKSIKGTSCRQALSHFQNSAQVWAETKYDGERAQIHVETRQDGSSKITIFSKSGRDSTLDRHGVHDIIQSALSLNAPSNQPHSRATRIKKNIVLDAEMVAWCNDHVDEFWRIRGLTEQTAVGARSRTKSRKQGVSTENESHEDGISQPLSTMTDGSQSRHLALIFFDVLVLDDEPLIFKTYATRRQVLETHIKSIPSKAMLSKRHQIDMFGPDPHHALQSIFAEHLGDHLEGLILKADESQYNEFHLPWVKLKKDYIPGFGDCIDLIIVAAGWDRDRARELRVTPSVYTTFYVGAITNVREVQAKPDTKPHIFVYFTVSYGLDRDELEDLNFRIQCSGNSPHPAAVKDLNALRFTFTISEHLKSKPQAILHTPFLAELLCAGFTIESQSRHYEPRFPRFTKVHTNEERPWMECMDISELDKIARECVGKDRLNKDIDDWCKSLWGQPTSPTVSMKRHDRVQDIQDTLASLEGCSQGVKGPSKLRKLDHPLQKTDTFDSTFSVSSKHFNVKSTRDLSSTKSDQNPPSIAVQKTSSTSGILVDSRLTLVDAAVSCFINSLRDRPCDHCSRWKQVIPRERRVHSLDALLTACGQVNGLAGMNIKRGIIFIDGDDSVRMQSTLRRVSENSSSTRLPIFVFRCNAGILTEENALLVV